MYEGQAHVAMVPNHSFFYYLYHVHYTSLKTKDFYTSHTHILARLSELSPPKKLPKAMQGSGSRVSPCTLPATALGREKTPTNSRFGVVIKDDRASHVVNMRRRDKVSFIDLKVLLCVFVSWANKSLVGTAWKNLIIQLCVGCPHWKLLHCRLFVKSIIVQHGPLWPHRGPSIHHCALI